MLQTEARNLLRIDGVVGLFVSSRDGLTVAAALIAEEQADVLSGMSAAIFAEIDRNTRRLGLGPLNSCTLQSKENTIRLLVSSDLILGVITRGPVNLGMVNVEMKALGKRLPKILPISS